MTILNVRKIFYILTLALVFIFALGLFERTPYEKVFFQFQGVFIGLILIFLLAYIVTILFNSKQINKVVLYYLLLIAVIPFYGAHRAWVEFDQPFIYGFLSERSWLLVGVGIWLYYVIVTKKMSLETVESTFVLMAWGSLIIFSLFILTFDPVQLQNSDKMSHLVRVTENRGLRFKFQIFFIYFGAIYYFVKYFTTKQFIHLIFFFIFLGYLVFIFQSRSIILALAATFLLYFWFNYSLRKFSVIMIKLSFLLFLALLLIQIVLPEYIERMSYLFIQMFEVIAGRESGDSSANARIFESLIVFDYFHEHLLSVWFGTGSVSRQWNGGYDSIVGYFYPSDIGVLGGVFVYGVLGFIFVCLIPVIISIKIFRKITTKHDIFIMALKYLLLFALIRSVQGIFYFKIMTYIIPLFILIAYLKIQWRTNAY